MTTTPDDPYPDILSLHALQTFLTWYPDQPEYLPVGPTMSRNLRALEIALVTMLPGMTDDATRAFGSLTVQDIAHGQPLPEGLGSPGILASASQLASELDAPMYVKWLVIDAFVGQRVQSAMAPILPTWDRFLRETGLGLPSDQRPGGAATA